MKHFRFYIKTGVLLAVILLMTKNMFLYGLYLVDNKTFVVLFCENKNKPEKLCNGKCAITKIQQQEQQTSKADQSKHFVTRGVEYFSTYYLELSIPSSVTIPISKEWYLSFYQFEFIDEEEEPPRVSFF